MPRSRRGGSSRSSSSSSSGSMFGRRPASTTAPAPRPAAAPPAPQQQSGGMLSGIGSTIAQGMAFGTGSAIAHRAVGAAANALSGDSGEVQSQGQVLEGQQQQPMQVQGQDPLQGACGQDKQMFFECLKVNQGDQQSCSFLYQTLQECQRNQNQMSFQ